MDTPGKSKDGLFENQASTGLIGYAELASWLSLTVSALQHRVHRRQIPFVKVGRAVRFDPREIEAWLTQRSHDVSR